MIQLFSINKRIELIGKMADEEPLFEFLMDNYVKRIEASITKYTTIVENWVDAKTFVAKMMKTRHAKLVIDILVEELHKKNNEIETAAFRDDSPFQWDKTSKIERLSSHECNRETTIVLFYSCIIVAYMETKHVGYGGFYHAAYLELFNCLKNGPWKHDKLEPILDEILAVVRLQGHISPKGTRYPLHYVYDYVENKPLPEEEWPEEIWEDGETTVDEQAQIPAEDKQKPAEDTHLLTEMKAKIAEKDKEIAKKDELLAEKDKMIAEKDEELAYYTSKGETINPAQKLRMELVCQMMEHLGAKIKGKTKELPRGRRARAAELASYITGIPDTTSKPYLSERDVNMIEYRVDIQKLNALLESCGIEWKLTGSN